MHKLKRRSLLAALVLAAFPTFGQTAGASFDVATIKPAPPLDAVKLAAVLQAGGKMPIGASVEGDRAEYLYLDLKSLISYAYGVKPYQITGPDWLANTRFDIVAKMPEGSRKNDASAMLRALLEDRFKLTVHRTQAERPVLALVPGKELKLKSSTGTPVAIDPTTPLKPGETQMEDPEGYIRMTVDPRGGANIDMGLRGKMIQALNPAARTLTMDFSMMTLAGFADMVTQVFSQIGGNDGRQIVDMTGIKGNYDASIELSLLEILAMARSVGADLPPEVQARLAAADPGTGSSLRDALDAMGLKLESRKTPIEMLVVDHIERVPTEN
jgi:uncharacterized protein (TIGR03435 family)